MPRNILFARLRRLLKQWQTAKGKALGELVLLREPDPGLTDGCRTTLNELQAKGARFIEVQRQPLVELAAYQQLLTLVLRAEYTWEGKPIEPPQYDAWASANLSSAVKELFDDIFGHHPAKAQPATAATRPQPLTAANARK